MGFIITYTKRQIKKKKNLMFCLSLAMIGPNDMLVLREEVPFTDNPICLLIFYYYERVTRRI